MGVENLRDIMAANRDGRARGVYAVCSAHPVVLEAAIRQGVEYDGIVLIEATANQVNQFGGYTGLRPAEFPGFVGRIARKAGAPRVRVVLGGDHLGPICWRREPAARAMAKAHELVAAYVEAGFGKIHLDTSMACAGDPEPLSEQTVARRAAELCLTAERAARQRDGNSAMVYVIGTEVPAAGGGTGGGMGGGPAPEVTKAESAAGTLEAHRRAFWDRGLDEAWQRVVGLVVEPGVGFDNHSVSDYDPVPAAPLKAFIGTVPHVVYEAHSTDYQTLEGLRGLVQDHFAILKVGPELTYALRQAYFALSHIEAELVPAQRRANLPAACEKAMLANPAHWRSYCVGGGPRARVSRRFGYSDRIRYYWNQAGVAAAVDKLFANLSRVKFPLPLIEQHMPLQYEAVRAGALEPSPGDLAINHVMRVTGRYARACSGHRAGIVLAAEPAA